MKLIEIFMNKPMFVGQGILLSEIQNPCSRNIIKYMCQAKDIWIKEWIKEDFHHIPLKDRLELLKQAPIDVYIEYKNDVEPEKLEALWK